MEIILGKTSGFCAGVKNAVENAQKEVEKTKGITYCLGELVHNKQVVEELESKGLKTIENIEEAKSKTIIGILFCLHKAQDAVSITFKPFIIISS